MLHARRHDFSCNIKFFPEEHSLEEDLILSAEQTMVYHGVMHYHNNLSMDCCMKIIPAVFPDSKIAKKTQD